MAERGVFSRPPDIMIPDVHLILRDLFAREDGVAQQVSSKGLEVPLFDDAALVALRMVPRRIGELLDGDLERLLGQYVFCPRHEGCGRRRSTSGGRHIHVAAMGLSNERHQGGWGGCTEPRCCGPDTFEPKRAEGDDDDDGGGGARLNGELDTSKRIASGEWLNMLRVFPQQHCKTLTFYFHEST